MNRYPAGKAHRQRSKILPRYCWDESPTWGSWVRLSAADIHKLTQEPGYEGQNVYFYLNHPVRYVRLVGVITELSIYDNGGTAPKLCVLTVDDGSGLTVGVILKQKRYVLAPNREHLATGRELSEEMAWDKAYEEVGAKHLHRTVEMDVDGIELRIGPGIFDVFCRNQLLNIGTVINARGTISDFRDVRQLNVARMSTVQTLTEEVVAWNAFAAFKRDVLLNPWRLAPERIKDLEARANEAQQAKLKRARKRADHEARKRARSAAADNIVESVRKRQEIHYNAGALPGSDMIFYPW